MNKLYFVGAFALSLVTAATPAAAQDADRGWSVTVTPRFQYLLFLPDTEADGLESLPSYGATVTARDPSNRIGLTGTYIRGKSSGRYTYDDGFFTGDYDYSAKREEIAAQIEYTPSETGVTLLAGYHRFYGRNNEVLVTPSAPGNSEVGRYRQSVDAAEIGIRLTSRLGANSRHSVSAQFMAGIGKGNYKADVVEVFGGVTSLTNEDKNGTGYIGDVALGYNYFLTDHVSLGARGRGYVFYAEGGDALFAVAPELNISFRF